MVELRKRPAPPAAAPPAKKKAAPKPKAKKDETAPVTAEAPAEAPAEVPAPAPVAKGKGKKAAPATKAPEAPVKAASDPPQTGETISLAGFGGEIETNDGEKTTLAKLVEASKAGVVLFTYPKASTPGCTTQVCLFRDAYTALTSTGLAIYGLSTDSPKANTTFKTKQKLPYPLLCDPAATLIKAIGFKKAPKGTTRGVFVVDKKGEVLVVEAGGPAPTLEAAKKAIEKMGGAAKGQHGLEKAEDTVNNEDSEDKKTADAAAEVADDAAAAKIDA